MLTIPNVIDYVVQNLLISMQWLRSVPLRSPRQQGGIRFAEQNALVCIGHKGGSATQQAQQEQEAVLKVSTQKSHNSVLWYPAAMESELQQGERSPARGTHKVHEGKAIRPQIPIQLSHENWRDQQACLQTP